MYHKEIKCDPERISKIKPFINNFDWENINFPPQEQDFKTFEMNNNSIALNILQVTEIKISHYCKSEFNKTRENKAILLMITDNKKQNAKHSPHYLAVKKFNSLFKRKTEHSGAYCLDCFKFFRNKKAFKNHKC